MTKYSLITSFESGNQYSIDYRTKREVEAAFRRSYKKDRKNASAILKNMGWYEFCIFTEFGKTAGEVYIVRNY